MNALALDTCFPAVGDPIPDGVVGIEAGDRIVCRGRSCGGEVCDLGNVAILPGLVNAHAHLDFSDLTAPLGANVASRLSIGFAASWTSGDKLRPPIRGHARGLDESLRCGVTALGDIVQPDGACRWLRRSK